jgi:hypothetical protein
MAHSPFFPPGGVSGDEPAERAASLGLSCRWRLHGPEMRRSALPVRENRTVDRSGDPWQEGTPGVKLAVSQEEASHVPVAQHIAVRPVGLIGRGSGHGLVSWPSDQRWSMTSPLTTVASLASAIAGHLSATAPAAATPRLSRSSCPGFVRRRSGRPTTTSRPASAVGRWLDVEVGAGVEVGADDAVDERSRVSASRYASVHMAAIAGAAQRSSWMRIRLPAGSRKAQSRTPYGCSVGSWTTSASLACSRSKVPSRSLVARSIQP